MCKHTLISGFSMCDLLKRHRTGLALTHFFFPFADKTKLMCELMSPAAVMVTLVCGEQIRWLPHASVNSRLQQMQEMVTCGNIGVSDCDYPMEDVCSRIFYKFCNGFCWNFIRNTLKIFVMAMLRCYSTSLEKKSLSVRKKVTNWKKCCTQSGGPNSSTFWLQMFPLECLILKTVWSWKN